MECVRQDNPPSNNVVSNLTADEANELLLQAGFGKSLPALAATAQKDLFEVAKIGAHGDPEVMLETYYELATVLSAERPASSGEVLMHIRRLATHKASLQLLALACAPGQPAELMSMYAKAATDLMRSCQGLDHKLASKSPKARVGVRK